MSWILYVPAGIVKIKLLCKWLPNVEDDTLLLLNYSVRLLYTVPWQQSACALELLAQCYKFICWTKSTKVFTNSSAKGGCRGASKWNAEQYWWDRRGSGGILPTYLRTTYAPNIICKSPITMLILITLLHKHIRILYAIYSRYTLSDFSAGSCIANLCWNFLSMLLSSQIVI